MDINQENYYDKEMWMKYMHVSTFKDFVGCGDRTPCEARALATLKGEFDRSSDALLIGSYLDCALTEPEKLEEFKESHPEMFSSRGVTKGELKSNFARVNQMVERVKKDEFFMKTISCGENQKVMVGEIFGVKWAIRIDIYKPNKAIIDLKSVESINKTYFRYDKDQQRNVPCNFITYWNYPLQLAIYQEVVKQNTGKTLPCFLAVVSKEPVTDFDVIRIDDETLHDAIYGNETLGIPSIEDAVHAVQMIKEGVVEPCMCGKCDYCKSIKKLTKVTNWLELGGELD